MITTNGGVTLLDFGAAREFHDENKSLSVLLKHGYAPVEQYTSKGHQGPFTDVYALSATIYKAITGATPENAMDRVLEDALEPPSKLGVVLPSHQEATLMKGLAVHQRDRFQSISELQTALLSEHGNTETISEQAAKSTEGIDIDLDNVQPSSIASSEEQPPITERLKSLIKKKNKVALFATLCVVVIVALGIGIYSVLPTDETPATPDTDLSAAELLDLGEKYLLENDYEQALVQFLKAIEIEPGNARGYTGAAEAYIGLSDKNSALNVLRQGIDNLPDDEEIVAILEGLTEIDVNQDTQSEQIPETTTEPIPTPDSRSVISPINILANMSKAERTALNTFFSNFSEVCLDEFDADNYSVNILVDFALWHNYRNSFRRFSSADNGYLKLSDSHVEQAIYRYFGISNIDHTSYSSDWNYYRNGSYYLMGAEGDPLYWSQVTYFTDNGDGTFTAQYDVYASHEPPENLYDDITDWRLNGIHIVGKDDPYDLWDVWEACVYEHSCIAVVASHEYNGMQTYKLLHLDIDRT